MDELGTETYPLGRRQEYVDDKRFCPNIQSLYKLALRCSQATLIDANIDSDPCV